MDVRLNCYTKLVVTKKKAKPKDKTKNDCLPLGLKMEEVGLDLVDA